MTMHPWRIAALAVLLWTIPALGFPASLGLGAGAGYKRMLAEINAAFTGRTGVVVEESYGHLGHITAQARQSGRMDVVVGDLDFLRGAPGLNAERFLDLGRGRLVVAWGKWVAPLKPADLARPGIDRIALPDARNAIYGKAGMEFLERSGLLASVRPRLIEVGTVPQVTAYLASGEVQAGLLNVTDALAARDKIGGFTEVDQSLYAPIRIVAAVLPGALSKPEVARYLEFLARPEAKAILEKYGL